MLSFADNSELSAIAQEFAQAYISYAFDQVPLDALHLTIRRVGFTDEIGPDALDAIAALTETLCADVGNFELTIGPVAASRGAVRFTVAPWRRLFEIYDAIESALHCVTGREPLSARESFRPHVSVAYSRMRQDVGRIRSSISKYRNLPLVVFKGSRLELVELRRETSSYRWNVIGDWISPRIPAGLDLESSRLLPRCRQMATMRCRCSGEEREGAHMRRVMSPLAENRIGGANAHIAVFSRGRAKR
jgi:2'-5' RNA ligase